MPGRTVRDIIFGFFLIAVAREYVSMAHQIGYKDAFFSVGIWILLALVVYLYVTRFKKSE